VSLLITELTNSRELQGTSRFVWRYQVSGTSVIDDVASLVILTAPTHYGFWRLQWYLKTIVPDPMGGGVWNVEVPYGVGDFPLLRPDSLPDGTKDRPADGGHNTDDPLGREWSMDFGQGTRLLTKSRETLGGNRLTTAAERVSTPFLWAPIPAQFNGAVIGYNPESGDVSGVEIPSGTMRLTYSFKVSVLTMDYVKKVRSYCSPEPFVNSEAFLGYEAGEVKFIGATIQWSQAMGFQIRFEFEVGKNRYGVSIDDSFPTVDIKAWHYLDVTYRTFLNPAGPTGVAYKAVERYVIHRVLPEGDLNDLFT